MKNILIPTDFSDNAANSIRYALDYFYDTPVNFYILHVHQDEHSYAQMQVGTDTPTFSNAASQLKKQIKFCQSITKNIQHKFFQLYEESNLVDAIRKQVAQYEIDYILMGTKGASKNSLIEMGSNTCEVITKVKCPILVIPGNARFKEIKNIAFVTDYNCIYRTKIISTLSETLELHNTPLRILHVRSQSTGLTTAQTDNKGFLHYFFREKKHSFHFVENKNLETGIQDFAETWDISLIAIAAKNLNFIERLLLRPSIHPVSYHTTVPFLVIHE